ncbi:MAG: queuosine precursor transporter [Dehalococcoidia bacterium]|nr:queuosine precursor transporter [Dehalococcoidia bacterium]
MVISHRLLIISAIFITSLITANIIAVKLIVLGIDPVRIGAFEFPAPLPAAIIIFPLSYIFGDILTEVYGYRVARRVIWLGFLCNLFAVIAFALAGLIPALDTEVQGAYERILGYTPRLLAASFAAYLVGEFANAFVLAKMKVMTKGRFLWTRTIGSTIVGQGLDSAVFIAIAFAGVLGWPVLAGIVLTHWLVKTGYEIAATPLTYAIVNFLKRSERIDTFDRDTEFNPLLITR